MKNNSFSIATNLGKYRKAACYTEDEVALAIGIDSDEYRKYEHGNVEISYYVLEKLSIVFGCNMYSFYEETDESSAMTDMFAINLKGMGKQDISEITRFKDIVMSYLRMVDIERS